MRALTSDCPSLSQAVEGSTKIAFEKGLAHYDEPPPEVIQDIKALRDADRFSFANVLSAWVEVNEPDGSWTAVMTAGGLMGSTSAKVGPTRAPSRRLGFPISPRSLPSEERAGWLSTRQPVAAPVSPLRAASDASPSYSGQAPLGVDDAYANLHADGRGPRKSGESRFPRHWARRRGSPLPKLG